MKQEKEILAEIAEKVNKQIELFEKQQKKDVILLFGNTGSGKSAIYNFLIGGEFIIENDDELKLISQGEQYSTMISGLDSVTKELKCYYVEKYQHLIVDFPGFGDTDGPQDEIVFQSLYNKITSKSNLKIVYVSEQCNDELHNRGTDLQQFLKQQICQENNIQLDSITLLMNQYMGRRKEENIKAKWNFDIKGALKQGEYKGKIIIQRSAKDANQIQEYFSPEQKERIWQELVQTPAVKLKPLQFTNRDIITSYLTESINQILEETFQELQPKLSTLTLTIEQLAKVIQQYTDIQGLFKLSTIDNIIDQIDDYLKKMDNIKKTLTFQSKLEYDEKIFKVIYVFFLDFKDQIDGYKQVGKTIADVTNSCNVIIVNLNNQKVELKKRLQEVERLKAAERELEIQRQNNIRLQRDADREWKEQQKIINKLEWEAYKLENKRAEEVRKKDEENKEIQRQEQQKKIQQLKVQKEQERQEKAKEKKEKERLEKEKQKQEVMEQLQWQESVRENLKNRKIELFRRDREEIEREEREREEREREEREREEREREEREREERESKERARQEYEKQHNEMGIGTKLAIGAAVVAVLVLPFVILPIATVMVGAKIHGAVQGQNEKNELNQFLQYK